MKVRYFYDHGVHPMWVNKDKNEPSENIDATYLVTDISLLKRIQDLDKQYQKTFPIDDPSDFMDTKKINVQTSELYEPLKEHLAKKGYELLPFDL